MNLSALGSPLGSKCVNNDICHEGLVCDGNLKVCRKEATTLSQPDPDFCIQNACQEWEGDCDSDAECEGDLICCNNCNQPQHSSWPADYDCCRNVTGENVKGASRYDVRIRGGGGHGKADVVWEVA